MSVFFDDLHTFAEARDSEAFARRLAEVITVIVMLVLPTYAAACVIHRRIFASTAATTTMATTTTAKGAKGAKGATGATSATAALVCAHPRVALLRKSARRPKLVQGGLHGTHVYRVWPSEYTSVAPGGFAHVPTGLRVWAPSGHITVCTPHLLEPIKCRDDGNDGDDGNALAETAAKVLMKCPDKMYLPAPFLALPVKRDGDDGDDDSTGYTHELRVLVFNADARRTVRLTPTQDEPVGLLSFLPASECALRQCARDGSPFRRPSAWRRCVRAICSLIGSVCARWRARASHAWERATLRRAQ
jgi:hypothetical protein